MASSRGQWADILDPSFRQIYGEHISQLPNVGKTIFNVFGSSKDIEKDSSASGLSKRALGSQITLEMWEDDQFGVMQRRPRDLARAQNRTVEQSAADIFNHGFTAGGGGQSTFTAGDAVALFSSAHPRTDGGANQSNTTTADLAEDSLETALTTLRATLDDKGQLVLVKPDTILVPPALEKEARILLDSQGRTGTGNNDINPFQGALKVIVWDYLGSAAGGSDTAWFIVDSSLHLLNWFDRSNRGIEGPEYDFDTKTAKWSILLRYSVGFSDWRGTYGSQGDNS